MPKRLKAFHIENARLTDSDAGWDIYLFVDGTEFGTIVWKFYGHCGSLGNVDAENGEIDMDDVFSDREIDRIWDGEFRVMTPPRGVRQRVLTEEQFHSDLKPSEIVREGIGSISA